MLALHNSVSRFESMVSTVCRHVVALSKGTETYYQITMFDCSDSKAQLLCQTTAYATRPSNEPWQIANCIQLESFRHASFTFCGTRRCNDCTSPCNCHNLYSDCIAIAMRSIHCMPQMSVSVPFIVASGFLHAAGMSLCCSCPR